jgi:hypothetical protein
MDEEERISEYAPAIFSPSFIPQKSWLIEILQQPYLSIAGKS